MAKCAPGAFMHSWIRTLRKDHFHQSLNSWWQYCIILMWACTYSLSYIQTTSTWLVLRRLTFRLHTYMHFSHNTSRPIQYGIHSVAIPWGRPCSNVPYYSQVYNVCLLVLLFLWMMRPNCMMDNLRKTNASICSDWFTVPGRKVTFTDCVWQ